MVDLTNVSSPDRLGLAWSAVFAYGLGVVVLGSAFVLLVVRLSMHIRRAKAARTDEKGSALVEGHVVLTGTVEVDTAGVTPIRIRIEQSGREWSGKNGWHHAWKEESREVHTEPFTLALDSGERIRVVPDEHVFLVDMLDFTQAAERTRRTRGADLTAGERASIVGVLRRERDPRSEAGAGYRDGGTSLVLRRAKGERMLVSTSPLHERHAIWVRFYSWSVAVGAVVLVLLHGLAFYDFHRLNVSGEVIQAQVVEKSTYVTHNKNSTTTHYHIEATFQPQPASVVTVADDTTYAAYQSLKKGDSVPFLVVRSSYSIHQIGTQPGIPFFASIMMVYGAFALALLFFLLRKKRTPWYELKKVVETGSGRLPG